MGVRGDGRLKGVAHGGLTVTTVTTLPCRRPLMISSVSVHRLYRFTVSSRAERPLYEYKHRSYWTLPQGERGGTGVPGNDSGVSGCSGCPGVVHGPTDDVLGFAFGTAVVRGSLGAKHRTSVQFCSPIVGTWLFKASKLSGMVPGRDG